MHAQVQRYYITSAKHRKLINDSNYIMCQENVPFAENHSRVGRKGCNKISRCLLVYNDPMARKSRQRFTYIGLSD